MSFWPDVVASLHWSWHWLEGFTSTAQKLMEPGRGVMIAFLWSCCSPLDFASRVVFEMHRHRFLHSHKQEEDSGETRNDSKQGAVSEEGEEPATKTNEQLLGA